MLSKLVILCVTALVGSARAGGIGYATPVQQQQVITPALAPVALVRVAVSNQTYSADSLGNVAFAYNIEDENGATNGRGEQADASNNRVGYYTLTDVDGRVRRVDYVADADGFRASIQTNEPGTLPAHSASAAFSAPGAPAPIPAAVPEPVAVAPAAVSVVSAAVPVQQQLAQPLHLAPYRYTIPAAVAVTQQAYAPVRLSSIRAVQPQYSSSSRSSSQQRQQQETTEDVQQYEEYAQQQQQTQDAASSEMYITYVPEDIPRRPQRRSYFD